MVLGFNALSGWVRPYSFFGEGLGLGLLGGLVVQVFAESLLVQGQ